MNVAARIADYARQGEVLVSQDVVDASDGAAIEFSVIGPVELKGPSESVRLLVARRAPWSPGSVVRRRGQAPGAAEDSITTITGSS